MRSQTIKRSDNRRGGARGFSLVELLIVVAVILIIASIAIPNFMRSRMRANESAAVASLRNITTAEVVYSTTYGIGFSSSLLKLGPPPGGSVFVDANSAGLIDDILAAGTKSGYTFTYAAIDIDGDGKMDTYKVNADPLSPGSTGDNHFFVNESGVIKRNSSAIAGPADTPIS